MKLQLSALMIVSLFMSACQVEGTDSALFNNVNELIVSGENSAQFQFDHSNILMIVHLHKNDRYQGLPAARLTLDWSERDAQGNWVSVNKTEELFYNAVAPGDYFARSFIDLNRDSELDAGEPVAYWLDERDQPRIIHVRDESRWRISFFFESRHPETGRST